MKIFKGKIIFSLFFIFHFSFFISAEGDAFTLFPRRKEINNLYRAAELDIKSQFYAEAVKKYAKLLALGVDPREINFYLAGVYFQAGKYPQVIEKCQWCLGQKISSGQRRKIYQLLGKSYFELGKYAEAIGTFREALGKFPKDARLHYWLGLVYYRSDLFNEALKECERAINRGLSIPGLWLLAGDICCQNHLRERAIQYYEKVKAGAEIKEAKYKLARIFLQQREFEKARKMFGEVLNIEPDFASAEAGIGESYFRENRFPQAEKFFQKALQLDPQLRRARIGLSIVYLEKKDYEKAQEILNQIRRGEADFQSAYFLQGLIYYYKEEFSRAKEIFEKIQVSGPDGLVSQLAGQFLQVMEE